MIASPKMERFLFEPVALSRTAIFRVLLALMLAHVFKPAGLVAHKDLADHTWLSGIVLTVPYWISIYAVLTAFALGYYGRIFGLILFLLLLPHCYLSRGHQSRQVMVYALLCFSMLPSVPLWKLWGKDRAKETAPIWPIRLVQIQLTIVYGINAIYKSTPHYLSGEALQGLSTRPNFHVELTSGWMHLGFVSMPVWVVAVVSVIIEYTLAVGFWSRKTRYPTALLGVAFHVGLMFVMTIYMLDDVSMFLYLAFLIPFTVKSNERMFPCGTPDEATERNGMPA